MDDFIRYYIMYDNPWRDDEVSVKEIFKTEDEARDYLEENPSQQWPVFKNPEVGGEVFTEMQDVPNYLVEVTTSYRKM